MHINAHIYNSNIYNLNDNINNNNYNSNNNNYNQHYNNNNHNNNNNQQQQHHNQLDDWLANIFPQHTQQQQQQQQLQQQQQEYEHLQQQQQQQQQQSPEHLHLNLMQQLKHYAQKAATTTTTDDFNAFAMLQQQQQQLHHQQHHHHLPQQQALTEVYEALTRNFTLSTMYPSVDGIAATTATTTIHNGMGESVGTSIGMAMGVGEGVGANVSGGEAEEYAMSALMLLFITIFYGLVVFGGVLGNASLMLTLCSASSVRLRNPLLLAVCVADLLVTGLSAPLTLLNLAINRRSEAMPLPLLVCKVMHYVQVWPVAASTISFFMLSLDRYATVKHPRLAQLRQSRYLHLSCALLAWLMSAVISAPFLFAYKIMVRTVISPKQQSGDGMPAHAHTSISMQNNSNASLWGVATTAASIEQNASGNGAGVVSSCTADVGANSMYVSFIIFHTIAVFVIPGLGVLINHYGVRQKLCALSLTARAAHGELPLPMPILRRQTHMVIVTGMAANAQQPADDTSDEEAGPGGAGADADGGGGGCVDVVVDGGGSGSGEAVGDIRMQNLRPKLPNIPPGSRHIMKSSNPISPRAMREIRNYSQRQRINGNSGGTGGGTGGGGGGGGGGHQLRAGGSHNGSQPGWVSIPLPQTSTLRSRRRLANMLIASALIFIGCWAPHVFCVFYTNFGYTQYCTKTSTYLNLLLGYLYSALSPLIYWALNHNTLRQSPCAIIRLRSMQNFLRTRFRSNTAPPPPSSTNEAALGAFNPKLIKLTPKQYRAQASSHYLY